MRIIRFLDDNGKIIFGKDLHDGSAEVIHGDPMAGELEPTGETVPIGQLRAPIEPANIFCIGKNYLEHATEFDGGSAPGECHKRIQAKVFFPVDVAEAQSDRVLGQCFID